jgi:LCP family protein required for cell wall assembly
MRYVDLGNSVAALQEKRNEAELNGTSGQNVDIGKTASSKKKFPKFLIFVAFVLVVGVFAVFFGDRAVALFDPVSIVSTVAAADLKESDGRTNVLILGSDKRSVGETSSELTDTLLVASIGRVEGNVVLISLPRDLWVKAPSGYHSKINAVYAYGGSEELMQVIEDILGVPIHYYAVVNFDLFKDTIDILEGIEIDVEKTFDDFYYPVEGKENAPDNERYETIHFDAGPQTMDGDTALKFVRSRKGTNDEGTDFARAARQQKVIMAIKNKIFSLKTILDIKKLKELYDTYSENVDTNLSFADAQGFYLLSEQLDFDSFRTIVLDDRSAADSGGLLYAPIDRSLYGGAYVLIPRAGDFSQLHAYVQRYIFGE